MAGGRPRKPDAIKAKQGTLRKHRQNKRQPKLPAAAPEMPSNIASDPVAAAEWRRLVAVTLKAQVLTEADRAIVEIAAAAYSTWRDARDVVSKEGMTYETVSTTGAEVIKPRPEVAIESDAWRRYRSAIIELGLTPAARGKVNAIEATEEEDPADAFFH